MPVRSGEASKAWDQVNTYSPGEALYWSEHAGFESRGKHFLDGRGDQNTKQDRMNPDDVYQGPEHLLCRMISEDSAGEPLRRFRCGHRTRTHLSRTPPESLQR